MASNRSEIFHFLLFCHFGFLTEQSVFLCQSPLAPGSLPYFHSMLSSPVVRDKLEPLSAWYTVWSFGSTLISTFPFSPCALVLLLASFVSVSVFSLCGGFFEEVGGGMEGSSHFGVLQRRTWFSHALLWIMRTKHL